MSAREPANPFYVLLSVASVLFVVTALALALVPLPQQPVWFRDHGWKILLIELVAVMLFSLASMALDRIRSLRRSRETDSSPNSR